MKTNWVFISAACLALNLTLGKIAAALSLPVYLDCVGTILGAVLLPPFYVVSTALLTSLLGGIVINPYFVAYTGTQVAIALTAICLCRIGVFKVWWSALLGGVVIALVAVVVSAPVTVLLFGGVTLSGTTAINAVLLATGQSIWKSVVGGSMVIEAIDKPTAALLAWLALRRFPKRLIHQNHNTVADRP
ncbi:MAG: ECF transporter S component [bacterium]